MKMKKLQIFIKISLLIVISSSELLCQSDYSWMYLTLDDVEEPYENIYEELKVINLNSSPSCDINFSNLSSYENVNSDEVRTDIMYFNGDDAKLFLSDSNGSKRCIDLTSDRFENVTNIEVDRVNQHIVLADNILKKLFRYSFSGNFISESDLDFEFVLFKLTDEGFAFLRLNSLQEKQSEFVRFYDKELNFIKEYQFLSSERVIPGYIKRNSLQIDNGKVYFNPTYSYNIYELSSKKKEILFSLKDFVVQDNFKKDPVHQFMVSDNTLMFTQTIFNRLYSFVVDMDKKRSFVIHNSIPIRPQRNNFKYYFVHRFPSFKSDDKLLTYVSKKTALNSVYPSNHHEILNENGIRGTENIKDMNFLKHDFNFLEYKYNMDFFERNAKNSFVSLFPEGDNTKQRFESSCDNIDFDINVLGDNLEVTIKSKKDLNIDMGIFSILERVSHEKLAVKKGSINTISVRIPQALRGLSFLHFRDSEGCRYTKQFHTRQ